VVLKSQFTLASYVAKYFFLVQKRTVQSVWMGSKIPPAPNVAISSVLLVSAKPCSMIHTVLLASMYFDLLLGSSHKVDK